MQRNGDNPNQGFNPFPAIRPIPNHMSGVPYTDAIEGTNEVPLDEIDSYIIPAQDTNHVSEAIHFRCPPYLKRGMKLIVASGRFPFLDVEDFCRYAAFHTMNWMISLRESLPKALSTGLQQLNEVCADDEMRAQIEQSFLRLEERIKYHLARGDMPEVFAILNRVKARMANVHPSARMREWSERFEKTYAQYLYAHQRDQLTAAFRVVNEDGTVH